MSGWQNWGTTCRQRCRLVPSRNRRTRLRTSSGSWRRSTMSTLALHQVDCNDTITNSFRHKLHGNSMLLHGRHGGVPAFLIKSCANYILSSARSLAQIVETWRVQITKLCQAIQTQDHKSDSTCSSNTACRRLHIAVRRRLCATNRNPASEIFVQWQARSTDVYTVCWNSIPDFASSHLYFR